MFDHPFSQAPAPRSTLTSGRIPVVVLTGFLGAGKTTLVRQLLDGGDWPDTAVVVNEFGEIGIDDALLSVEGEETMLLGGGCVCCAARSDLQRALRSLFQARSTGAVPSFQRVLIETSGLADPSPVLQTFVGDRTLGTAYVLAGLVAAVDAATALESAELYPEWRKQVALADTILVTKGDLVSDERRRAVEALIAVENSLATVSWSESGRVPPAVWGGVFSADASLPRCVPVEAPHDASHTAAYSKAVFVHDAPVDWATFDQAMLLLSSLCGRDLLRAKGFVRVRGQDGPAVVQVVQHLSQPAVTLKSWPDGVAQTRLVFITSGVPAERITALLEAVFALDRGTD